MRILKPEYQDLADEWDCMNSNDGCICNASSMPPCGWCENLGTHGGNPEALADNNEAWVNINENEDIKIMKIEKAVLINGKRVNEFEFNELIDLIKEEQGKAASLKLLNLESKIIDEKIKEYNENINLLTEIIDK